MFQKIILLYFIVICMDIQEAKMCLYMEIQIQKLHSNTKYFHLFYQKFVHFFHFKIENFKYKNENYQQQELHFGNNFMFQIFLQFKLHFLDHNL